MTLFFDIRRALPRRTQENLLPFSPKGEAHLTPLDVVFSAMGVLVRR